MMNQMNQMYPFSVQPLPYTYNDLAPYISSETVKSHYENHYSKYVKNLNDVLSSYPDLQDWSLKALLVYADSFPNNITKDIKVNAGGVYNHEVYFDSMSSTHHQKPKGELLNAIIRDFGSFENLQSSIKSLGTSIVGSGWVWLMFDTQCRLRLVTSENQNVPPISILYPLLNLDVWEHAYYIDRKERRGEYIDAWFNLINWSSIENLFPCG